MVIVQEVNSQMAGGRRYVHMCAGPGRRVSMYGRLIGMEHPASAQQMLGQEDSGPVS